jgi:hypothetical protein
MSDIDDLLAKQEIAEVIYRYCRGIDRMDAELTLSCWHEGGLAHYGRLFEGTAEGFVEWLWPVHATMVGHRHEISNILVHVRDDRASSEAYVSVTLRVAPAGESQFDILGQGRYLDRWERRGRRWGIVDRTYVSDLNTTRAVEDRGVDAHLAAASSENARPQSRRDRSDPSYQVFAPL